MKAPALPSSLSPALWETTKAASGHGIISVARSKSYRSQEDLFQREKDALRRAVLTAPCGGGSKAYELKEMPYPDFRVGLSNLVNELLQAHSEGP